MTKYSSANVLILASHNSGKLRELEDLLKPYDVVVRSIGEWSMAEPEETATSFRDNARIKAKAALHLTGCPSLADDSGLEVKALDGAPGVHSARWAGSSRNFGAAMQRITDELSQRYGDFDAAPKEARFVSVLALIAADGREFFFEGHCSGHLVASPRGENGFGYDPIFVPDGASRTFGEMQPEEKKRYSHRARAFGQLGEHIRGRGLL